MSRLQRWTVPSQTHPGPSPPLPDYYSGLRLFYRTCLSGVPILTYHHVGPRPSNARIKGLYLSARRFERQLRQLRKAGFSAPGFGSLLRLDGQSQQRCVFLTFDDGHQDVFNNALPMLQQYGFKSIQFLVSDLIGKTSQWGRAEGDLPEPLMDAAQVRDWLAAGHSIGSHTRTHPRLTHCSPPQVREEIEGSKKSLEDQFSIGIEHFCYPYGDYNPQVRDKVMAAGYKTACTVISGVNAPGQSPFELKRFMARYPSTNLKALWSRCRAQLACWRVGTGNYG